MELEMFAYRRYAAVAKYTGSDKHVVIPQKYNGLPVTEIREGAFAYNKNIEAVFVPSTLQSIGARAFECCRNLKYVGVGLEDESLGDISALPEEERPDLSQLSSDDLPDLSLLPAEVRVVAYRAFSDTAIQNIEFKADTVELGDAAFEACPQLQMVAMFNCRLLALGKRVFMDSSISRFYAPKVRIDTVPEYTFANCSQLVSVMACINAVAMRAFYRCKKLKKLDTPKGLRSIGREAFDGCDQLEGIKLPPKKPPVTLLPPNEWDFRGNLVEHFIELSEEDIDEFLKDVQDEAENLEEAVEETTAHASSEGKDNGLGQPLFRLRIDYRGKPAKTIPSRIKGCWGHGDGTFHFSIQTPSSLSHAGMQIMSGPSLTSISPLMNYIVKNSITTTLLGKQEGGVYAVYEMLPVPSPNGKSMSTEFLHEVIQRIRHPITKDADPKTIMPPFTMQIEADYEAFIEICGNWIPDWVIHAYNKNKYTIQNRGGRLLDDECKHARRAQELLMNIDWLPCVVNVPPAEEVRRILDEEFFGLEPVKERIMEVVAQIRRTGKLPKWGILIHGPAGIGKTSIAKAIARIFGMPLIQMDMSSVGEDPDEISGSSRIYGNARPGMMLESMFQNRSSTAVLLANEVDKAGEGKGSRCAANILLSILDKTGFYENFLEEIIPTDNLFCIGTCNDLSAMSKPLKDRFLVINIAGYTPSEKKVIFQDYVFPRAKAASNVLPDQIELEEDALNLLVTEYAREPGARDLEQYAERFVGNYSRSSDAKSGSPTKRVYTTEDIRELFGPGKAIYRHFGITPGEVNAAFYHDGKAHFFLMEASVSPGPGNFKVLGPMAALQKDYCEVAYWCARNTISASACDFTKCDVTIFVPQPIPDGTANHVGLACYTAICSKIMNTNLAISETCFIGGCDMNGSLYFDENDLTPLLRSMKARGVSTLYAPMGTNRLVNTKVNSDCNVMIVEAPDAKTLFSLAVTQGNHKH